MRVILQTAKAHIPVLRVEAFGLPIECIQPRTVRAQRARPALARRQQSSPDTARSLTGLDPQHLDLQPAQCHFGKDAAEQRAIALPHHQTDVRLRSVTYEGLIERLQRFAKPRNLCRGSLRQGITTLSNIASIHAIPLRR